MTVFIQKHITIISWSLATISTLLAIVTWGSLLGWDFTGLFETTYTIFPLLGLIAFSLMWGHYIVWALREMSGASGTDTKIYTHVTQGIVLLALLLHPGLIIWQLFQDGYGIPPDSYVAAYGEELAPFILLGTLSLFAFLAYELKRWLETKKIWKCILGANHIAMILILIHAFKLGTHVQSGWFRGLFIVYGLTLIATYIYLGVKKKLFE